jgi:hypothetical protein
MRQEPCAQNPAFQTADAAIERHEQHHERDQNHQRDFQPDQPARHNERRSHRREAEDQ